MLEPGCYNVGRCMSHAIRSVRSLSSAGSLGLRGGCCACRRSWHLGQGHTGSVTGGGIRGDQEASVVHNGPPPAMLARLFPRVHSEGKVRTHGPSYGIIHLRPCSTCCRRPLNIGQHIGAPRVCIVKGQHPVSEVHVLSARAIHMSSMTVSHQFSLRYSHTVSPPSYV